MKYLRLTSIAISKNAVGLPLYIIDTNEKLKTGMTVILNGKAFKIGTTVNKPGNPKTGIIGNFL